MSSDNGVYCLKTPKGDGFEFRVAELQGIDTIEWDEEAINPNNGTKGWYNGDPSNTIKGAREYFKNAALFTIEKEALEEAFKIHHHTGYTEYGICFLEIPIEF